MYHFHLFSFEIYGHFHFHFHPYPALVCKKGRDYILFSLFPVAIHGHFHFHPLRIISSLSVQKRKSLYITFTFFLCYSWSLLLSSLSSFGVQKERDDITLSLFSFAIHSHFHFYPYPALVCGNEELILRRRFSFLLHCRLYWLQSSSSSSKKWRSAHKANNLTYCSVQTVPRKILMKLFKQRLFESVI